MSTPSHDAHVSRADGRWRRVFKTGFAQVFRLSGAGRCVGALSGCMHLPVILGYHRVVEDFEEEARRSIPSMLISTRTLERHLDWLGKHFRLTDLDEAAAQALDPGRRGKPSATVSFDDGYADVYEHAFPLLRRKGIPFAVFVVTDLPGSADLQLHDELYALVARAFPAPGAPGRELPVLLAKLGLAVPELKEEGASPYTACRRLLTTLNQAELKQVVGALREHAEIGPAERRALGAMSWEMLTEMQRAGVTIGSHSRSHARLGSEMDDKLLDETLGSKREAERHLGAEIRHFAYPDGDFDAAAVEAVASAGYRYAYTICRHRAAARPEFTIPRRSLWERSFLGAGGGFSPALMSCHVNGVFDFRMDCAVHQGL